jgi:hypothetical protein
MMSTDDRSRTKRALGLAVVAAATSIACTETPPTTTEDASRLEVDSAVEADASTPVDAAALADASTPLDAAIAMDASAETDASFAEDDADLPDGHYPDGVRG